jgi:UDP:flavonoid glycosyltransferase YjiC (YdhE family)
MTRFLFCTVPVVGHINPGLPIARALVGRGHEVCWYTGRKYQTQVEATGARYEPMRAALDYDDQDLQATFPDLAGRRGLSALKLGIKHLSIDSAPGQLEDLQRLLAGFPAEVLVADTAFFGALFAHERGGPPRAVYGVTPLPIPSRDTAPFGLGLAPSSTPLGRLRNRALYGLFDRVLFRDVHAHYNRVRARVGLLASPAGVFNDAVSPHLYLQGTVASFEYPRSDLPPQVHFIGPFLPGPSPDFTPPAWWDELRAAEWPVVHVTQGTITTDPSQLLVPTRQALAGQEVLVVATTGGQPADTIPLTPLPANVRLAPFIPYFHLLPQVDVMVTNGGYGGVQAALANGVPLVAAGRTEEKPEICARVAWAGVGINLKTNRPTPDRIREAVRAVLADPRYRHNAQRLAADIARHDAPAEAATLLERLAATKQPVTTAPMPPSRTL